MAFDANTITALQKGGLVLVDFLTIRAPDGIEVNLWSGPDNVTANVVSAADGSTDSRDYIGGGALIDVPPIIDKIGLGARQHTFTLSALHSTVNDMIYGAHPIRLGEVEYHRGLRDVATWALVSTPFPYLLGIVDGLEESRGAIGEDGSPADALWSLMVTGDAIELNITNPALKSDEQQRLRSGDRIRRYADPAAQYDVWWGDARATG